MHKVKNRHYSLFCIIKAKDLYHRPGVTQLGTQQIDDLAADFFIAEKMLLKITLRDKSDNSLFVGNNCGRSGLSVEERHLTKIIVFLVNGNDLLATFFALFDN